jgi:molecular chaperone Hsp33
MLGAMLKGEQRVSVQIMCDGPVGGIHTDADAKGNVRGYVRNPHVDLDLSAKGKLDVAGAVGKGTLYLTREIGLKEPYTSSVPLVSGELGQDFAYLLVKSEQTPAVVSLGVLVDTDFSVRAAGGFIIQAMPGADAGLLEKVEAYVSTLLPVSSMVDSGADATAILQTAMGPWEPTILEERPLRFHCPCSKDRFTRGLITLGPDEIKDMLNTDAGAELICHFCNERYEFTNADLQEILVDLQNTPQ